MLPNLGVVIFDDPTTHDPDGCNHGWACIYSDEPFEVEGTGDLSTSAYWWMNLNPQSAANHKLLRTPRFLDSSYLRTDLRSIARELGISDKDGYEQVIVLSKIFHNVVKLAKHCFGFDHLPRWSLSSGIAQALSLPHPEQPSEFENCFFAATQTYTECQRGSYDPDKKFVSFVLDRCSHADYILSKDLPSGVFRSANEDQVKMPARDERAEWLVKQELPIVVEYSLESIHPVYNPLVNYGAGAGVMSAGGIGAGGTSFNHRRFCTLPELASMNLLAESVNIGKILVDTTIPTKRFDLPFAPGDFPISFSAGLLAESIWVALGRSPVTGRLERNSPVTAWIHALDRMRCLAKAALAKDAGFEVVSYGYGRVVLALNDSQHEAALTFAREQKMIPPIGFGAGIEYEIPEKPDSIELRIALGVTESLSGLMNADAKLVDKFLKQHISNPGNG